LALLKAFRKLVLVVCVGAGLLSLGIYAYSLWNWGGALWVWQRIVEDCLVSAALYDDTVEINSKCSYVPSSALRAEHDRYRVHIDARNEHLDLVRQGDTQLMALAQNRLDRAFWEANSMGFSTYDPISIKIGPPHLVTSGRAGDPLVIEYMETYLVFPVWVLPPIFLLYPAIAFVRGPLRRRLRRRRGLCVKCGYSLRGLTEPRCPECGTGFQTGENTC
jgi:hypothetical protein